MAGNVLVIGSFMMDLVVRAPRRPRSGETVLGTDFEMFLGGKGFNQAVAAARCGANTSMLGRLGADDFGSRFLSTLADERIDASRVVVDASIGTGIGAPVVDEHGENSIVIVPRANMRVSVADVLAARSAIASADVLLLQLELPHEVVLAAAELAKDSGTTVVLNPAPAPPKHLIDRLDGLVDVLVPNEIEAAALCTSGATGPAAASELCERLGASVVMTLGARGCVLASVGACVELPSHVVTTLDTVGAGDAFCGALGAWLSSGAPLVDAMTYANAAGAIAVTRQGAEPAMPHRHEVVELADRSRPASVTTIPSVRSRAPVAGRGGGGCS